MAFRDFLDLNTCLMTSFLSIFSFWEDPCNYADHVLPA